MKRSFSLAFILPVVLLARVAYGDFTGKGHVHTLAQTQQVFVNRDCRSTATCDLKRFTLTQTVYEVWFSDDPDHPTHGSGVIMEYETDSVEALERYVIVQFKKGCVFYSSKNDRGEIRRNVSDTVASFGDDIPFCFPKWVIDSQDRDPAYNSDPEYGRFHLLRWNKPGSYDQRTQKFYGAEKPHIPIVYMADYPAGAFATGTGARNVALDFKTCIYKASSVPTYAQRDDVHFASPIACFEWQTRYVYDFTQGRFQTRLAELPWWEKPERSFSRYLRWSLIALLIALALAAAVTRCGKFLGQKQRR